MGRSTNEVRKRRRVHEPSIGTARVSGVDKVMERAAFEQVSRYILRARIESSSCRILRCGSYSASRVMRLGSSFPKPKFPREPGTRTLHIVIARWPRRRSARSAPCTDTFTLWRFEEIHNSRSNVSDFLPNSSRLSFSATTLEPMG